MSRPARRRSSTRKSRRRSQSLTRDQQLLQRQTVRSSTSLKVMPTLHRSVVTPVPEQQPTNQTGDDATTPEAAAKKAQMLMERLGAERRFRNSPRATRKIRSRRRVGGDIGLVPMSRLMQAPPAAQRRAQEGTGFGRRRQANGAYTLVLVVSHRCRVSATCRRLA